MSPIELPAPITAILHNVTVSNGCWTIAGKGHARLHRRRDVVEQFIVGQARRLRHRAARQRPGDRRRAVLGRGCSLVIPSGGAAPARSEVPDARDELRSRAPVKLGDLKTVPLRVDPHFENSTQPRRTLPPSCAHCRISSDRRAPRTACNRRKQRRGHPSISR